MQLFPFTLRHPPTEERTLCDLSPSPWGWYWEISWRGGWEGCSTSVTEKMEARKQAYLAALKLNSNPRGSDAEICNNVVVGL